MEASGRADGGRDEVSGGDRGGGQGGDHSPAGFGLHIVGPVESADGVEGLHSPSIQDILVALPADFDLQQAQPASDGSAVGPLPARGQVSEAWRRAQPYRLPEQRPRPVGANFRANYNQMPPTADQPLQRRLQPTAAAAVPGEHQLSQLSGFEPDQWSQRGRAVAQAADATYFSERPAQQLGAQQWRHHQKRRRMSESANATASDRQRGEKRPVDGKTYHPPLSAAPSPSSANSDEDDDGSSLARAMSATRSQIDAMAMAMTPSSSVLSELEVHAKRKRPGKHVHKKSIVASERSNRELVRPPLHTASSNGSTASLAAQEALEEKPAAAMPPPPPSSTEPQRAATVTASTSNPPERQATCRVAWCSQPGKRFGLCWTHGGVKRCCESNCARVALETSEFCSFHQPKHSLAGRTASI